MERSAIKAEVDAFVTSCAEHLGEMSKRGTDAHTPDALADAANLVAAVIDTDGRATDAELWAYVDGVGHRLNPPIVEPPNRLREARITNGKAEWLAIVSPLLDLLIRADRRDGRRRSHDYYSRALRLAHAVAAVDLVPTADEIAGIDRFRSTMLAAMDAAGTPRPGTPGPGTPGSATPPPATPTSPKPGRVDTPTAAATADGSAPPSATAPPPTRTIEELLAELDELVGLQVVKTEVRRLTSMLQVQRMRAAKGLAVYETSHHLVFTGNPGTGKTTVARLLSQIYRALGVVTTGHLVETDRSALVAGFVGQTAAKTLAVLEAALGGTLLIDEAYALARGGDNDFGREAIDTVVKFMEDHRDDLAVIAAGYPTEMTTFIDANPGLKSRFTRTLHFADYTVDELVEIFVKLGAKHEYTASDGALAVVQAMIASEPRDRGFGNARYVRNLFEEAVARQAERVAALDEPDAEQLTTFVAKDIIGNEA